MVSCAGRLFRSSRELFRGARATKQSGGRGHPSEEQVHVEMKTSGRLVNNTWSLDADAVVR
jgi:hypothetical protein